MKKVARNGQKNAFSISMSSFLNIGCQPLTGKEMGAKILISDDRLIVYQMGEKQRNFCGQKKCMSDLWMIAAFW